jgi:hypothetical protein
VSRSYSPSQCLPSSCRYRRRRRFVGHLSGTTVTVTTTCTHAMRCRSTVRGRSPATATSRKPLARQLGCKIVRIRTPTRSDHACRPLGSEQPRTLKLRPPDPSTGKAAGHVVQLITTAWYNIHCETGPERPGKRKRSLALDETTDMLGSAVLAFPRAGDAPPGPSKPARHPGCGRQNAPDERTS